MRKYFRDAKLSKKNREKLDLINDIIYDYQDQGYRLTLRQLYYQLVTRNVIPNKQTEYAKLSNLLKEGRMSGIVDWDAIEDRLRVPKLPYYVRDTSDAMTDTINQYRLDRQRGQNKYIEVWVEKDALSGVLSRITEKYHVRLMVNRGYSSVSAMYAAYNRFANAMIVENQDVLVLYLGDHDPSGLDMIRDIKERVSEMLSADFYDFEVEERFQVEQIGLNMEQIIELDPPPNPAKITDPRAKWYIEKYGPVSWEVDALNPATLNELVEFAILENIDQDLYEEMIEQEEDDKNDLRKWRDEM